MAARNATSILGSIRIFGNKTVICQDPFKIHSRGVWFGDDPLFFSAPLLILQLSLVFMSTRMAAFFLKPLGQPMIVSQIIGGIILGPSILGRNKAFTAKIFPSRGTMVLDTVGWFGLILFLFLEGVKMDVTSVKQSGRKAMAIGISAFFIPLVVASIMSIILIKFLPMEPSLARALPYIAIGECLMPFVVVSCLLTELRILNTELGRLAITSSMYGEVSGITMSMVSFASSQNNGTHILSSLRGILASIAMIAFIGVVFRPAVLWLSKQTPEGKSVPELHIFAVTVSVLVAAFVSITIGQNMVLGPLVLGLAVPDGPPMGSALVERLDSLISGMFFPIFFAISGLRTNLFAIEAKATWIVGFVVTITCVARAAAVMLPSLFYDIPMRDAVVLGLMLNSKGIIQMISYNLMNETKTLNEQEYALLVLSVIFITGIAAPLLRSLYNPSQKYVSAKRRTIQHAKHGELRILVCIHSQDNVPTMLNLLEISHASKDSPISVLLLNLFELVGRASPILIAHQFTSNTRSSSSSSSSRSDKTINAFRHYELHNHGSVTVQPFTAISHVATMHDDVCQLALDRKTTIIIVPFHKQWAIDGTIGSVNPGIRAMNRNILDKAPCSVGILVDRGIQSGSSSVITSRSVLYRVTVLFMGGPDDGEALAYGERMSQQHNVKLTVIRFQAFGSDSQDIESDENLDDEVISEFKLNSEVNELSEYREEVVRDGEELVTVIRGLLKDGNDLTIVGRHHGKNSSLLTGFNEWSECPELGIIGDILASPDFGITSSVLVVQQ